MPVGRVATINIDDTNNVSVNVKSQEGEVRKIPLKTATLNIDENGNLGVFIQGSEGGGDVQVGNLIAGLGIKIDKIGDNFRISVDDSVVDTTFEVQATVTEMEETLKEVLNV
jgi:DNA-binding beta-propeller fold protein YncE